MKRSTSARLDPIRRTTGEPTTENAVNDVLGGVVGEEDEEEGRAQQVQVAGMGGRPHHRRCAGSAGDERRGLLLLLVAGHRELVAVFHGDRAERIWGRGVGGGVASVPTTLSACEVVIWGKGEGLVFLNLRSRRGVYDKLDDFSRIAGSFGGLGGEF
uniref:Uncharacterized protein n=1 Tax=Oryza punctata TaxID=4537 RepID=A0A0E0MNQ4_ORYPU